ncbi:hypothetical protein CMV_028644, partial [Castanea mollissima]
SKLRHCPQQETQRSSCALRVQSSDKVSPHRHTRSF